MPQSITRLPALSSARWNALFDVQTNPTAYSYVRFSRPEQMRGDSLRRQIEASQAYAKEHGLHLDTTLEDKGVSAFHGKNAVCGALSGFLAAIEAGKVPKGSVLLVESLDRLSRQAIEDALAQFLAITRAGVAIVTLADGRRYESGKLDLTQLVISLTIMSRAHEESAMKSFRLAAVWANKRAKAATEKPTRICPGWLRLSPDRRRYELIPERAKILQRIFDLASRGMGRRLIARELNREKVQPWGVGRKRGTGWHDSYIIKILQNRGVLGEYQPCKLVKGRRVPVGEVIKDYYPAVISQDEFYQAQAALQRRKGRGGRIGKVLNNLFSGLCTCSVCGGNVVYTEKGRPEWRYLVCANKVRGLSECDTINWNYHRLEKAFLKWIPEALDGASDAYHSGTSKDLRLRLDAAEGRKAELKAQLSRLHEAIALSTAPVGGIMILVESAEAEVKSLNKNIEALRSQAAAGVNSQSIADIARFANDPSGRFALRDEVRRHVKTIICRFARNQFPATHCSVVMATGETIDLFGRDVACWGEARSDYYGENGYHTPLAEPPAFWGDE